MTNTTPEGLAERAEAGHTRRDGESMNDFAWRAVEESGAICKELVIALRSSEEQRDRMRGALEEIRGVRDGTLPNRAKCFEIGEIARQALEEAK